MKLTLTTLELAKIEISVKGIQKIIKEVYCRNHRNCGASKTKGNMSLVIKVNNMHLQCTCCGSETFLKWY